MTSIPNVNADFSQRAASTSLLEEKKTNHPPIALTSNTQELYLRGEISIDEAFNNLIEMADAANIPFSQVYQFVEATPSHQNPKLADDLKKKIRFYEEGQEALSSFANEVRTHSPHEEKIAVRVSASSEKLFTYLRVIHSSMLLDKTASKENKDIYRRVKKDFRVVFRELGKANKSFNSDYQYALSISGGRKRMNFLGEKDLHYAFKQAGVNYNGYFYALIDELTHFRKDYLLRYSKAKVERFLAEEKERLQRPSQPNDSENWTTKILRDEISSLKIDDPESLNLLPLTFIHGSTSAIMPNLPLTNMCLLPSGRLFKLGIVPFSGELREGSKANGVNQSKVSGTSLDYGFRAVSYTSHTPISFQDTISRYEELVECIKKDLERNSSIFTTKDDTTSAVVFIEMSIITRRFRALSAESFDQFVPTLTQFAHKLEADYNAFKQTDEYKKFMPKQEDPTGELGYEYHDYYWYSHFSNTEHGIHFFKDSITDPLLVPENLKEGIESVFPMIFGSTTLNPITMQPTNPTERHSAKPLRLGDDLQYIFVPDSSTEKVRSYLQRHGFENAVQVVDRKHLEDAILLNCLASPYFCDIASIITRR
jgi:hypothetical protein